MIALLLPCSNLALGLKVVHFTFYISKHALINKCYTNVRAFYLFLLAFSHSWKKNCFLLYTNCILQPSYCVNIVHVFSAEWAEESYWIRIMHPDHRIPWKVICMTEMQFLLKQTINSNFYRKFLNLLLLTKAPTHLCTFTHVDYAIFRTPGHARCHHARCRNPSSWRHK